MIHHLALALTGLLKGDTEYTPRNPVIQWLGKRLGESQFAGYLQTQHLSHSSGPSAQRWNSVLLPLSLGSQECLEG